MPVPFDSGTDVNAGPFPVSENGFAGPHKSASSTAPGTEATPQNAAALTADVSDLTTQLNGWAQQKKESGLGLAEKFESTQTQYLVKLKEEQRLLKESEELHGEQEYLGYENIRLDDQISNHTHEIEKLEIELEVIHERKKKILERRAKNKHDQEDEFEQHVLRYFNSISDRLGLEITVHCGF